MGQLAPLAGEYNFGTNVQIGYFDQQMAMYSSRKTVLDDFWDEFPNLTETEARNALGAFMFTGEDVFKILICFPVGRRCVWHCVRS